MSILNAARLEFAARGYTSAAVSSIARTARVSVGAVYLHFGSKRALALWCAHDSLATLAAAFTTIDRALPPQDQLKAMSTTVLQHALKDPVAYRLSVVALLDPVNEPGCAEAQEAITRRVRTIMDEIRTAARLTLGPGASADAVDPMVAHLWGSWTGVTNLVVRSDGAALRPEAARDALDLGARLIQAQAG